MKVSVVKVVTHWQCDNDQCLQYEETVDVGLDQWTGEFGVPVCGYCEADLVQLDECTIEE